MDKISIGMFSPSSTIDLKSHDCFVPHYSNTLTLSMVSRLDVARNINVFTFTVR